MMKSWSQGYVADIPYSAGFYHHQAPVALRLATLVAGFEVPALDSGFDYCELACGQGLTATLLAAANPRGRFTAVDFNPAHIAHARAVADRHGIDNLTFLENSFEELVAAPVGTLPLFDVVTLHGVYSWVSPATRAAIVEFLRRYLKPGGIAYVSYNSLPGWSSVIPLQRLIFELTQLARGRSDVRLEEALKMVAALRQAGAIQLGGDKHLDGLFKTVAKGGLSYLVHEYVNEWWQPLFHLDVVRDLAAAKLDFVGSAVLLDNFPTLAMTPEQLQLWNAMPVPEMQETLRDHFVLRLLRKDVFVRGARRLTAQRQEELLRAVTLAAIVGRSEMKITFNAPLGVVELESDVYGPMLDALADGPRSVGELMDLPAVKAVSRATAVEVVSLLTANGQVMPILPGNHGGSAAASLNAETLALAEAAPMSAQHALAAPLLGSAIHLPTLECCVLAAEARGEADVLAHLRRKVVSAGELPLDSNGQLPNEAELDQCLDAEFDAAWVKVELLRRLGLPVG